ncbi:hypothetical protein AGMMS49960_10140 [Betaproteobacteria bacterium]|nr:hypothetical protein AGMMS49543_26670 [Betaproteobacteria bacterium]GHU00934.1 hypothetical protein AGMMS49960_10140 [Betaproteobacteria bacterium]GHU19869.1 hypothetical protein AGMMS50243_12940 [Betaproteobacteria bacterium]
MKKQRKNKLANLTEHSKSGRNQPIFTLPGIANDFVRGFVTTGTLAVLARPGDANRPRFDATVFKHATLAGAALVAGVAAGKAVERGNYLTAALSAVGGVAGVYALDRLLDQTIQQEGE